VINIKKLLGVFMAVSVLFLFAKPASAALPAWDITGTWEAQHEYLGDTYTHINHVTEYITTTFDAGLSGYGGWNGYKNGSPTGYSNTWNITNMTSDGPSYVSGNTIHMNYSYTSGEACKGYIDATVNSADGSLTGTWHDNCYGERTGGWSTGIGVARATLDCPKDTTQAVLETLPVYPNGTSYPSSKILTNGMIYLVQASGTYKFANWTDAGIADAMYSLRLPGYNNPDSTPKWIDGVVFASPKTNWLKLWVNGATVNWGMFNLAHMYTASMVGTGTTASFKILDDYYNDNAGSLSVTIYSCTPKRPNLPTDKEQCKKGGWETFGGVFKNQGDCVSFVATGGKNKPALLPE
jgi:hypothetical protein